MTWFQEGSNKYSCGKFESYWSCIQIYVYIHIELLLHTLSDIFILIAFWSSKIFIVVLKTKETMIAFVKKLLRVLFIVCLNQGDSSLSTHTNCHLVRELGAKLGFSNIMGGWFWRVCSVILHSVVEYGCWIFNISYRILNVELECPDKLLW